MVQTLSTVSVVGSTKIADTDRPELQTIELKIPHADLTVTNFVRYSYNSHFLTPTDGWSFTVEDDNRIAKLRQAAVPGALCTLAINGHVQASGFIDSVDIQNDRGAGTTLTVQGRDLLSQVVDANADPTLIFEGNRSLSDILTQLFAPFGLDVLVDDNSANRTIITGNKFGVPTTKKGKTLKSFVQHQCRPYPKEGCFAFASRMAQRFGLWIWLAADGESVIVGQPTYAQTPSFHLQRRFDGDTSGNNVLSGGAKIDFAEQPDIVVAEGFSGGQQWGRTKIRKIAINPLTAYDQDGTTSDVVAKYVADRYPEGADGTNGLILWPVFPATARVLQRDGIINNKPPPPRVMFLHDDEAKTLDELEAFVRREMSLKLRKALEVHYTVEGHTQNGSPWCVDTMVAVKDDIAGIDENLWVLSRSFEKSRTAGTVTHLELIRPNTIDFGVGS